jgi:integrase
MATGIYKRGGTWWVRYTGLDGKQKRESSNSKDFKKAEKLLADRKSAIGDGKEPEIRKIPNCNFSELAEKYTAWIEGRQKSAKIKGYIIGQFLSVFGDIPLRRFSTALVDQFQTDLISKGYQAASNNKVMNVLKHMFSKAVEWDLVEEEALKRIRKVKPLKGENRRLRYLSREECHSLMFSCEAHLKPIVTTALNTGMRRGEILGLKWDNVDLKHGFILLNMTKNGERREIPINGTLKGIFQGITRRLDIPYVFHDSITGKPYKDVKRSFHTALKKVEIEKCTKCDYQKIKEPIQKEARHCPLCNSEIRMQKGITDFHFHDLRHTFASHLVMAGVDITTVKELLGHKDIKMTLRYAHLAPAHKAKAVDILDSTINGDTISTKLAQSGAGR